MFEINRDSFSNICQRSVDNVEKIQRPVYYCQYQSEYSQILFSKRNGSKRVYLAQSLGWR